MTIGISRYVIQFAGWNHILDGDVEFAAQPHHDREAPMSGVPSIAVFLHPAILALAAIMLGVASLNDIAVRTIPDLASLGLVIIGTAARVADHDLLPALAVSSSVLVLGTLCWRLGWLGGGDVKLLTACAWLVPPSLVPQLVLVTAIAGGVLACLYLALSCVARALCRPTPAAHPQSLVGRIGRTEWWRIRRRAALPYGCAIATATLLTLSGW
jgi:prepilin peptidase CpaA